MKPRNKDDFSIHRLRLGRVGWLLFLLLLFETVHVIPEQLAISLLELGHCLGLHHRADFAALECHSYQQLAGVRVDWIGSSCRRHLFRLGLLLAGSRVFAFGLKPLLVLRTWLRFSSTVIPFKHQPDVAFLLSRVLKH